MVALALLGAACQRVPETAVPASADADAQLLAEIRSIPAIDNHAHPVRPVRSGEAPDRDYDALPVDNLELASDPVRERPGTPELARARAHVVRGDPAKVLDQLGIAVMLANRVAMGLPGDSGLPSDRFLWVPYADALMYPLSNDAMIHNSDRKAFFALEEKLLKRYYAESGVAVRPASLDGYLDKVVRATLDRHKQGGAVAEKFEMAYLRPLDIGNPSKAEAEAAWAGRVRITRFRITFSASSRPNADGSEWPCTSIPARAAAVISTSPEAIPCCWSRCWTILPCAKPTSSFCTEAGLSDAS